MLKEDKRRSLNLNFVSALLLGGQTTAYVCYTASPNLPCLVSWFLELTL
jgi:hypothetical protein